MVNNKQDLMMQAAAYANTLDRPKALREVFNVTQYEGKAHGQYDSGDPKSNNAGHRKVVTGIDLAPEAPIVAGITDETTYSPGGSKYTDEWFSAESYEGQMPLEGAKYPYDSNDYWGQFHAEHMNTSCGNHSFNHGLDLKNDGGMVWIRRVSDNMGLVHGSAAQAAEKGYNFLIDTERTAETNQTNRLSLGHDGVAHQERTGYGDALAFTTNGWKIRDRNIDPDVEEDPCLVDICNANEMYRSWAFKKESGLFNIVKWTGDNAERRLLAHGIPNGHISAIIIKAYSGTSPALNGEANYVSGGHAGTVDAHHLSSVLWFSSQPEEIHEIEGHHSAGTLTNTGMLGNFSSGSSYRATTLGQTTNNTGILPKIDNHTSPVDSTNFQVGYENGVYIGLQTNTVGIKYVAYIFGMYKNGDDTAADRINNHMVHSGTFSLANLGNQDITIGDATSYNRPKWLLIKKRTNQGTAQSAGARVWEFDTGNDPYNPTGMLYSSAYHSLTSPIGMDGGSMYITQANQLQFRNTGFRVYGTGDTTFWTTTDSYCYLAIMDSRAGYETPSTKNKAGMTWIKRLRTDHYTASPAPLIMETGACTAVSKTDEVLNNNTYPFGGYQPGGGNYEGFPPNFGNFRTTANSNSIIDGVYGRSRDFGRFTRDGFYVRHGNRTNKQYDEGNANNETNGSDDYLAVTWKKQEKFFDRVKWQGNGGTSNTRVIPHQLKGDIGMMWIMAKYNNNRIPETNKMSRIHVYFPQWSTTKCTWLCWPLAFGDSTSHPNGLYTDSSYGGLNPWDFPPEKVLGDGTNSIAPTDTSFTIYANSNEPDDGHFNADNWVYDAWLWGHDTSSNGFIRAGNYAGNAAQGNHDTTNKITLGWRPSYVLIKLTDADPEQGNTSISRDWLAASSLHGLNECNGELNYDPGVSTNVKYRPRSLGLYAPFRPVNDTFGYTDSYGGSSYQNQAGIQFDRDGFTVFGGSTAINRSSLNYVYLAVRDPYLGNSFMNTAPDNSRKVFAIGSYQGGRLSNRPNFGTVNTNVPDNPNKGTYFRTDQKNGESNAFSPDMAIRGRVEKDRDPTNIYDGNNGYETEDNVSSHRITWKDTGGLTLRTEGTSPKVARSIRQYINYSDKSPSGYNTGSYTNYNNYWGNWNWSSNGFSGVLGEYLSNISGPSATANKGNNHLHTAKMWKRHKGFFDCYVYKGDGNLDRVLNHELGVNPSMVWIRQISNNGASYTYPNDMVMWHKNGLIAADFPTAGDPETTANQVVYVSRETSKQAFYNDQRAYSPFRNNEQTPSDYNVGSNGTTLTATATNNATAGIYYHCWGSSGINPTATSITIGNNYNVNFTDHIYQVMFFADCPGVAKTGIYTAPADGSGVTVNCGFKNSISFLLLRRVDGNLVDSNQWMMFDNQSGRHRGMSLQYVGHGGNPRPRFGSTGTTIYAGELNVTGINDEIRLLQPWSSMGNFGGLGYVRQFPSTGFTFHGQTLDDLSDGGGTSNTGPDDVRGYAESGKQYIYYAIGDAGEDEE